ncbi:MAG: hypothetical protein M3316_01150 [Actinomycetota bacterium]|jgi:hypothetical protein|nr:hypothetical protein [Actinomycetota bacterium]
MGAGAHLREDAGLTGGLAQGVEPAERLQEDTSQLDRAEHREDDKGLIAKAKDKLKGS